MPKAPHRCYSSFGLRTMAVRVMGSRSSSARTPFSASATRTFRLAVIPIQTPPLRERPDDVLPPARHFTRANAERTPPLAGWSDEVEKLLLHHAWPGNARALEHALERGVVLARGGRSEGEDLRLAPLDAPRGADEPASREARGADAAKDESLRD